MIINVISGSGACAGRHGVSNGTRSFPRHVPAASHRVVHSEKRRAVHHAEVEREPQRSGTEMSSQAQGGQRVKQELRAEQRAVAPVPSGRDLRPEPPASRTEPAAESPCAKGRTTAAGAGTGIETVPNARSCWRLPATIRTRRPNPVISRASSKTTAAGFVYRAEASRPAPTVELRNRR